MKKRACKRLMAVILALVITGAAAGAGLLAAVCARAGAEREIAKADCIIVLGALVWKDGAPSDALQYRLDSALEAYERGLAERIIVSGAQGDNEPCTEASAMKRTLIEMGVAGENIIEEDKSFNTWQNLENAKAIMDDMGLKSAIVVTSDYHVERALWIARDVGIDTAYGLASASPRPFFTIWRLRARECASWIVYCLRKIT